MKRIITTAVLLLATLPASAAAATPNDEAFYPAPRATSAPIIAVIHGGGWVGADNTQTKPWAEWLNRRGYAVVNVDYRLACDAPGCPHAPTVVGDVYRDIRAARARHTALRTTSTKVIAIGFSAGGHLAAMAASTGVANAAIGFSAPIALQNARLSQPLAPFARSFIGCDFTVCPATWRKFSPSSHRRAPMYLAYGELETLVPPALHGDFMPGAKVVRVPGDGHSGAAFPNGWEYPYVMPALRYLRTQGIR